VTGFSKSKRIKTKNQQNERGLLGHATSPRDPGKDGTERAE
jgi:hypothetical protein